MSGIVEIINEHNAISENATKHQIKFDNLVDKLASKYEACLGNNANSPSDDFIEFNLKSIKNGDAKDWTKDYHCSLSRAVLKKYAENKAKEIRRTDVRCVDDLIDNYSFLGVIPTWLKKGKYNCDYNEDGEWILTSK